MRRVMVLGLPRSGTTWAARVLAAAPGVTYVNEPDNAEVDRYAAIAFGDVRAALLEPATMTPRYRRLFDVAFRGGWTPGRTSGTARRLAAMAPPRSRLEAALFDVAARAAARRPPATDVVLVKSVAAHLAADWFVDEMHARLVVVWRHPLNVIAAWLDRGWRGAAMARRSPTLTARFTGTAAWPPPEGDGVDATAWGLCAQQVWLFEAAARIDGTVVLHHEATCLDPAARFRAAFTALDLDWVPAADAALTAHSGRGAGYDPVRIAEDEPRRWAARLGATDVDAANAVIERFATTSPEAAAYWAASPARVTAAPD